MRRHSAIILLLALTASAAVLGPGAAPWPANLRACHADDSPRLLAVHMAPPEAPAVDARATLPAQPGRFAYVHIELDSGERPLAAYQVELTTVAGGPGMQVVGITNGEHPAFGQPPYYDRDAVAAGSADRIILAAFSTLPAASLPHGRTRLATVNVRLLETDKAVTFQARLQAAADASGRVIPVVVRLLPGSSGRLPQPADALPPTQPGTDP